jgi:hypothetical protein
VFAALHVGCGVINGRSVGDRFALSQNWKACNLQEDGKEENVNNTNHTYSTATIHLPAARNFTVGNNASRNFDAFVRPGR